ncbi:aminotransferase class IV [Fulvivirga sedimenti]|uniref:branched-chain-amino-acid transaminase n=1 Tax=Fulvivirga sedimenti TaxID=2879465 RepID=A0A9X1HPF1_9BACT|nr:aminotransferase class IV [Fulvivirga sedimenti]MCA6073904.1 aminotransferase class IV [Fulvivirga sedimenti]
MFCLLNGNLVRQESAFIPVNDLTLRRGYGLFDFFRVKDNTCLYLQDHADRLFTGIRGLNLVINQDKNTLIQQIQQLVEANNLKGASGIRIVVTGGSSPDGFTPSEANIIITQERFSEPNPLLYENGTSIISLEYRRELATFKSVNYMNAVYMAPEMKRQGATEILYHFWGAVSECTRSNVFCISNDILYTPVSDILHGITRKRVLEIASGIMEVRAEDFSLQFLKEADEVFITSTIKRILPVSRIDHSPVSDGNVGQVTRKLMYLLQKRDQEYSPKLDI